MQKLRGNWKKIGGNKIEVKIEREKKTSAREKFIGSGRLLAFDERGER